MRLVDANVLIYAIHRGAGRHQAAKSWLDDALSSRETLLIPWVSLLAFLRLTTHHRVFEQPLTPDQALDVVEGWLSAPNVVVPATDAQHIRRIREHLNAAGGHGGNLINDAHLAALAAQHGAAVVTFDADFSRFGSVRVETPA
ncbi:TA system VapC family ribonuclease toxin [uncultured Agrococcus sp.]|uniref:TA system VapC family ribonuclease toxin n=1 Tax=uncultured Agrococcus sp. TaxID=382258 RepID=UPI0025E8F629|nr:TA system VapC family ribonuclease toxin [uncultured Agrococcus sp.]